MDIHEAMEAVEATLALIQSAESKALFPLSAPAR